MVRIKANWRRAQDGCFLVLESPVAKFANHVDPFDNTVSADPSPESVEVVDFAVDFWLQSPNKLPKINFTGFKLATVIVVRS